MQIKHVLRAEAAHYTETVWNKSSFVAYLTANALCFVCLAQRQLPCMDLVMYCK